MVLLHILRIGHANRSPGSLRNVKEIPLKSFFSFLKFYFMIIAKRNNFFFFVRRKDKLILRIK